MTNVKTSNKKFIKINEYFYMTPKGDVLKYKKYCIINDCKKLASFNYHNEKLFLYCNEHKLNNMINIKKDMFCVRNIIFLILKIHAVKNVKNYIVYYVIKMSINPIIFKKSILIILIKILLYQLEILLKRSSLI